MDNVERLKAIYAEKQAKYRALCDAVTAAYEAHQSIMAMCDEAMAEMSKTGDELIAAMRESD